MMIMAQGEAGAARALDPLLLGLVLVSAYVLLVATGLDDADLLRSTRIWRFGLDIDAAAGILDLPAVGRAVSISEFFLIAPGLVLALHVAGMIRLRARLGRERFRGPLPWPLVAGSLIAGPAALIGLQAEYAPFAAIRPTTGAALSDWWMSLWHVAAIGIAGVSLLLIQGAPDRPGSADAPGPGPGPALRLTLAAAIAALLWRVVDSAGPVLFPVAPGEAGMPAPAAPKPVLVAACLALAPLAAVALFGARPLAARMAGDALGTHDAQKGDMLMMFRVAGLALAAASFAQIAGARAIDVSGETLARAAPNATLIAAYVAGAGQDGATEGWARAFRDHAEGLDLSHWRLGAAAFDKATAPKIRLDRAELIRASFDGALLIGASFREARLLGARFVGARRGAPIRVAEVVGLDFSGADLRGAIFADSPSLEAEPADGDWEEWCTDSTPSAGTVGFLSGASLEGARLDRALLFGMDLSKVVVDKETTFKNADLRCARICRSFDGFRGREGVFGETPYLAGADFDCAPADAGEGSSAGE